jgi:hypothetical protein
MNTKCTVTAVSLFALCGCATQYAYQGAGESAELTIAGNSNHFYVETYKDETCAASEYGLRVATFRGPTANVTDHEKGVAVRVPADRRFVLSFRYIDAQFALNRMCSMMVGFSPSQGATYKAYFAVLPEVTGCGVSIRETTAGVEKEVPSFFLAPNVCLNGRDVGPISGRPQRLKWEVQVVR